MDARARLVVVTEAGSTCTRAAEEAAEEAAAEVVRAWSEVLGEAELRTLRVQLTCIASDGAIRPAW
ncbi:hypothetical protein [Streptomyces sp. NPDC006147]|uniref:hypothetical protein n=1 Tax=Streptomyces sp. NPDC006147 TaxID=3155597 RepID=UPI0033AEE6FF